MEFSWRARLHEHVPSAPFAFLQEALLGIPAVAKRSRSADAPKTMINEEKLI